MLHKRSPEIVARALIGHHPFPLNRRDRRAIQADAGRASTVDEMRRLRDAGVTPKAGPTRPRVLLGA